MSLDLFGLFFVTVGLVAGFAIGYRMALRDIDDDARMLDHVERPGPKSGEPRR